MTMTRCSIAENVELVTAGIDHLEEHAVVTQDGRTIPVDVLIYATGFESTGAMAIHGRGGRMLQDEWAVAHAPTWESAWQDFRTCS